MQKCGSRFGVFLSGRWVWYRSHAEAHAAETADLHQRLAARQAQGTTVIVSAETGRRVKGEGK